MLSNGTPRCRADSKQMPGSADRPSSERLQLTCFHLETQRLPAILDQPVQLERTVRDGEIEHLDDLFRLVKLDHLLGSVILALDVVEANLDHSEKELPGLLVRARVALERKQVCPLLWLVAEEKFAFRSAAGPSIDCSVQPLGRAPIRLPVGQVALFI